MLRNAAAQVAVGGRLIYATCSSEPEENDGVVDAFLASAPEFAAVDVRQMIPELAAVTDDRGRLRTQPHLHELEAFFAVMIARAA